MARKEDLLSKSRRRQREALGARMSDFRPVIVTPVIRQETETGWRVIMHTFPPTLLAEGVSEAEAVEIQEAKRAELGQIVNLD